MPVHAHIPHRRPKTLLDWSVTVMAVVGPLLGLPQIIEIYTTQNVSGLSLLAWIGFTFYTLVFLTFGIVHKLKPLIITQTLWLATYILIIIGILLYRS
jgi:uncharacterized protein with PQ loop repeat